MDAVRLLVIALVLAGSIANAQSYRGEAIPVVQRVDPVEFSRVRFLTFAFGHEGPMDAPLSTPPVAGREYFFEADIFGIESVATIRFELVDANGRLLQTVAAWKDSDASDNGEFHGFVTLPNQPFRFAASGTTTAVVPFRSVLNTLFQPVATGPAEQPIIPSIASPNETRQLQEMVAAYRQELKVRSAQAAAENPGGVITFSRASVSRITYEPLNSASGSPIGLRLNYSIRFPSRQTIVAVPHVFPVYQQTAWRGVVAMKTSGGTITPLPQMLGVQSPQDVILYRGQAIYQAGTIYNFTIDLVPDYIIQGTQTGRFCLYEQKFNNRAVWDALKASAADVPYSVTISDTQTAATIPTFFPQRTLYNSFTAVGAFDCGPTPNVRF